MKLTHDPQSFPGDISLDSSIQELDLGARAVGADGSEFRYVKAGATALVAGKLFDGPAQLSDNANLAVAAVAATGDLAITVTLGSTAALINAFAGGRIVINDANGEGFTYFILSHPAADAAASLVLTLHASQPVVTALTTDSQATLVPNQYNGVIIHASTETGVAVGGAITQVTAAQFGWLQTRGPIGLLHDATTAALGLPVASSLNTDGAVSLGTGALTPIGTMLAAGVSTEYNPVFMTLG